IMRDVSKPLPNAPNWAVDLELTLHGVVSELNLLREDIERANRRTGLAGHQDLVEEIKLILPTVDGELLRSNSQVETQTSAETNRFRGTVTWSVAATAVNRWNDASFVLQLGLTDEQIRKMDAAAQ